MIYGIVMGGGSGKYVVNWIFEIEKYGIFFVYIVGEFLKLDVVVFLSMFGMFFMRYVIMFFVFEESVNEVILDEDFVRVILGIIQVLIKFLIQEE